MPWRIVTIAVVGFLVAADAPEDKTKETLADLQGSWVLTGREVNGQDDKVPPQGLGDSRVVIQGTQVITFGGCTKIEGSLHFGSKSHSIDLLERTGNAVHALYRLEGDELKLCMSQTGERPTSFGSRTGNSFVVVYHREKPDDPDLAPLAEEFKKLQGAWKMKLKKDAEEDTQRDLVWVIKGNELTAQIDGAALPDKATVVVNPKMQPPVIGVMFPGSSLVGSYSLEDDVLTISTGGFGAAQKMIVLKRVTP